MVAVLAMLSLATWADPAGDLRLTVGLRLEPSREAAQAARARRPGVRRDLWLVLDHGNLAWFGVALETGRDTLDWPQGRGLAVTLKDGRRLEAVRTFAVMDGDERVPVELGRAPRRLEFSRLYRQRSTITGRVGAVLLMALPDPGLRRADIAALHVSGGVP